MGFDFSWGNLGTDQGLSWARRALCRLGQAVGGVSPQGWIPGWAAERERFSELEDLQSTTPAFGLGGTRISGRRLDTLLGPGHVPSPPKIVRLPLVPLPAFHRWPL